MSGIYYSAPCCCLAGGECPVEILSCPNAYSVQVFGAVVRFTFEPEFGCGTLDIAVNTPAIAVPKNPGGNVGWSRNLLAVPQLLICHASNISPPCIAGPGGHAPGEYSAFGWTVQVDCTGTQNGWFAEYTFRMVCHDSFVNWSLIWKRVQSDFTACPIDGDWSIAAGLGSTSFPGGTAELIDPGFVTVIGL